MADYNWGEVVNIKQPHRQYSEGKLNIRQLGRAVSKRLQDLECYKNGNKELLDIICELENLDEFSRFIDYQSALEMLWDFGDRGRILWIEGFIEDDGKAIDVIQPLPIIDLEEDESGGYSQIGSGNAPPWPYRDSEYNYDEDDYNQGDSCNFIRSSSSSSITGYSRYMTDNEFDAMLRKRNVDPKDIPNGWYYTIKAADEKYRDWLIEMVPNLKEVAIQPYEGEIAHV